MWYKNAGDEIVSSFVQELLPQYPNCTVKARGIRQLHYTPSPLETLVLEDAGARAIADGATQSQSLAIIILFGNELMGEGIEYFAERIPAFPNLKKLDLVSCEIKGADATAIAIGSSQSTSLKHLSLSARGNQGLCRIHSACSPIAQIAEYWNCACREIMAEAKGS